MRRHNAETAMMTMGLHIKMVVVRNGLIQKARAFFRGLSGVFVTGQRHSRARPDAGIADAVFASLPVMTVEFLNDRGGLVFIQDSKYTLIAEDATLWIVSTERIRYRAPDDMELSSLRLYLESSLLFSATLRMSLDAGDMIDMDVRCRMLRWEGGDDGGYG